MMKALSLFLISLSLFILPQGSLANSLSIELPESEVQEIEARFSVLKSNSWTLSDLEQILKYLIVEKSYDGAWIERTQDHFTIRTSNLLRIENLTLQGQRKFDANELKAQIELRALGAFTTEKLAEDTERLRNFYRNQGFPQAQVDAKITRPQLQTVNIEIVVQEGPQTKVRSIDLKTDSRETLFLDLKRSLLKFRKDPISEALVSEIVVHLRAKLSKAGYYKAIIEGPVVELSEDQLGADLTFTLKNTERFRLEISGYKSVTRGQIDQFLDLDQYFSQNPNLASELATKVKSYYVSKGFSRAQVASQEVNDRGFRRLLLKINEGTQTRIQQIEFQGTLNHDSAYYEKIIRKNASSLFNDDIFNREDLDLALKNFVISRQNEGFLSAKVLSTRTTFDDKKEKISIVINYSEGPQTILKNITFVGNDSLSSAELKALSPFKTEEPLKLEALPEYLKQIEALYQSKGYLEMQILSKASELVAYNSDNTEARVNITLKEGPQIIVGSIAIEGNFLTQAKVIMRELEFKVGDVLTPENIKETRLRLQKLRYFNSVEVLTVERNSDLSRRTVTVKVEEREPGVFFTGFGANNERELTLRGYAGASYGNLFGTGRDVSLRTDANYNLAVIQYLEYKLNFNYTEPALFGSRFKGKFDAIRSNRLEDTNLDNVLDERQYIFSTEVDFTSQFSLSYDLLNTLLSIQKSRPTAAVQNEGRERIISGTGPTFIFDNRDHQFNPTAGLLTSLNFEVANPDLGSSQTINYFRSVFSANHYLAPFSKAVVWANSFRFGHLRNWSPATSSEGSSITNAGVPYSLKGFLLGGLSTIRGFTVSEAFPGERELGTKDFYLTTTAQMMLVKSELRIPIYGNFGTAVFYDGGAVYIDGVNLQDPYRDSVGIAFRYSTPVGAVSLEWGWKLDRKSDRNESQLPFQFSIGTF